MTCSEYRFKGEEDFYFLNPVKGECSFDGGKTFRPVWTSAAVLDGKSRIDLYGFRSC